MTKSKKQVIRNWYSFSASELWKAFVIAAITLLIIYWIADSCWPRHYYLSDIQICNTTIAEKQQEDGKYYIRVSNTGISQPIASDNLWFEVKQDFYTKYNVSSPVGISIAKSDVYKTRLVSGGHVLESSSWEVQEIYGSYEEAEKANQYKKYSSDTVLENKKKTGNGLKFFILKSDDRSFTLEVDDKTFDKYSVNQQVKCTFEAVGEFVKLTSIDEQ